MGKFTLFGKVYKLEFSLALDNLSIIIVKLNKNKKILQFVLIIRR